MVASLSPLRRRSVGSSTSRLGSWHLQVWPVWFSWVWMLFICRVPWKSWMTSTCCKARGMVGLDGKPAKSLRCFDRLFLQQGAPDISCRAHGPSQHPAVARWNGFGGFLLQGGRTHREHHSELGAPTVERDKDGAIAYACGWVWAAWHRRARIRDRIDQNRVIIDLQYY